MRLLVVEDDQSLGRVLVRGLSEEGHAVDLVGTVLAAGEAGASGEHWREIELDGPLLAYARGIGNNETLVTVVDREPFEAARSTARWQWTAAAVAAVSALSALG